MSVHEKIETEKMKLFSPISNHNERAKKCESLKQAVGKVVSITVGDIKLNENVRKSVNLQGAEFLDLKKSIQNEGVLQPAVVELRELSDGNDFELVAVSGHRRIMACKELGIEKIKAEIKQYNDLSKRTVHALVENLMREDLHALDVAEGYLNLIEGGWTEDSITDHFSKDKYYIKNILKIAKWSAEAKEIIRQHPDKFSMRTLCNRFAKGKWENESELLNALRLYCGLSSPQESLERVPKSQIKLRNKLNEYFSLNKVKAHDKRLIEEALSYLGIKV